MVTHRLLQNDVLADVLTAASLPAAQPGDTVYRLMDDGTYQVQAVATGGALVTVLALPQSLLAIIGKLGEADGVLTYDGVALGVAVEPATITVAPLPTLSAIYAGDTPSDVTYDAGSASASDGSTVTLASVTYARGGTDFGSATGWVSAAAVADEIVRALFTFRAPGCPDVVIEVQTIVQAIPVSLPAFEVTGGENRLTILSIPTVTAPEVTGGVNTLQITG